MKICHFKVEKKKEKKNKKENDCLNKTICLFKVLCKRGYIDVFILTFEWAACYSNK